MKSISRVVLSLCVGILPLAGLAQVSLPYIRTHTEAHYQGDIALNDNDGVNFPVASLPAVAQSRSYVPVSGFTGIGRLNVSGMADIQAGWDDADAYARGQLPGNDGLYARAGGYSPGHASPPDNVNALASVELYRNYQVTGSGTVPLDLITFFEGFLYVGSNGGFWSTIDATVSIKVSMDGQLFAGDLFQATATLNHGTGFSTVGSVAGGHSLAGFNSGWADTTSTMTQIDGVDRLWELNYLESFNNIAPALGGEVIGLKYVIEVQANNNEGPFEMFATADFSNSFKFGLGTSDPNASVTEINLVAPVPEPATMALWLGVAAVVAKRRRRVLKL